MFKKLWNLILGMSAISALGRGILWLVNQKRQEKPLDWIMFTLPSTMSALPEPRTIPQRLVLGDTPMSLIDLERVFKQLGKDSRSKGVILHLPRLSMPLADLQTLRNSISRFKAMGKKVVCISQGYDLASYYVATVADEVILQKVGDGLQTIGMIQGSAFLKDALDTIGVKFDAVAITPFKGAADPLTRNDISEEGRQQLEWLLDSRYDMVVEGIAEARNMTREEVLKLIDSSPLLNKDALEAGYVDAILNQEGLSDHLKTRQIISWQDAQKSLPIELPKRPKKYVAVLTVSGMIVDGESSRPPINSPAPFVGNERAGDLTVVQQVRNIMKNKKIGAVVLNVDTGGGSASASEAMKSALDELGKDRPLVVYMNNVAASGGYFIATSSKHIVAQPGTITGSIGVIFGKPITQGMFEKLRVNRVAFTRGENAGINTDFAPFTDDQREIMRGSIEHMYDQFIERVADARAMTKEEVDAIGGGRVWTGVQAKEHGLVDELGDLHLAIKKAKSLANLPEDTPVALIQGKPQPLAPQLAGSAAALQYFWDDIKHLSGKVQYLLPLDIR